LVAADVEFPCLAGDVLETLLAVDKYLAGVFVVLDFFNVVVAAVGILRSAPYWLYAV